MNSRAMQIEFERRITLMNPNFELAEKLTSDTIFSFLNAYTERYVRLNYLQEDAVQDGTRAQKKNADALKGLITRGLYAVEANDENNTDKRNRIFHTAGSTGISNRCTFFPRLLWQESRFSL